MAPRSVIVTGAAQGVGAACARRFARAGDRLTLAGMDEEACKSLADEIIAGGGEATIVCGDISKRLQVHNIVAEALEAYGRVDVLAHTAIMAFDAPFLETTEDDFDRVIGANLKGAFLLNQAVAKQFLKQAENEPDRHGVIVNVGSVEAVTAGSDLTAFSASQGGLVQMTKAISLSLGKVGVRANAVGVGAIKTRLTGEDALRSAKDATPLKRLGEPSEAAEVVFFLASDEASFVNGQCIYVDGGQLAQSIPIAFREHAASSEGN